MSGSSGSSGGVGVSYEPPCGSLRFDAQLTSPKPAVVATLQIGDVLDIQSVAMSGQITIQVLKGGQVAGGLVGPDATRLRNCLDQGYQYQGTVRSINGGQVRVLVEAI